MRGSCGWVIPKREAVAQAWGAACVSKKEALQLQSFVVFFHK